MTFSSSFFDWADVERLLFDSALLLSLMEVLGLRFLSLDVLAPYSPYTRVSNNTTIEFNQLTSVRGFTSPWSRRARREAAASLKDLRMSLSDDLLAVAPGGRRVDRGTDDDEASGVEPVVEGGAGVGTVVVGVALAWILGEEV